METYQEPHSSRWSNYKIHVYHCSTHVPPPKIHSNFLVGFILFSCWSVVPACVCTPHVCTWFEGGGGGRLQVPWSWSYRWCDLPCGCWALNLDSREAQQVLLTAEPPLSPCFVFWDRTLLCDRPGWSWTYQVVQVNLELKLLLRLRSPKAGIFHVGHHAWYSVLQNFILFYSIALLMADA